MSATKTAFVFEAKPGTPRRELEAAVLSLAFYTVMSALYVHDRRGENQQTVFHDAYAAIATQMMQLFPGGQGAALQILDLADRMGFQTVAYLREPEEKVVIQ